MIGDSDLLACMHARGLGGHTYGRAYIREGIHMGRPSFVVRGWGCCNDICLTDVREGGREGGSSAFGFTIIRHFTYRQPYTQGSPLPIPRLLLRLRVHVSLMYARGAYEYSQQRRNGWTIMDGCFERISAYPILSDPTLPPCPRSLTLVLFLPSLPKQTIPGIPKRRNPSNANKPKPKPNPNPKPHVRHRLQTSGSSAPPVHPELLPVTFAHTPYIPRSLALPIHHPLSQSFKPQTPISHLLPHPRSSPFPSFLPPPPHPRSIPLSPCPSPLQHPTPPTFPKPNPSSPPRPPQPPAQTPSHPASQVSDSPPRASSHTRACATSCPHRDGRDDAYRAPRT